MAYDSLKSTVRQYIKTNDANEITGQILQNVLIAIIDELGDEYVFAGVATPSTDPGVPSRKVAYCASQAGTYTHFDGIVLPLGIHLLNWNGTAWTSQTFFTVETAPTSGSNNLITSGAVYQAVNSLLADGFLYAGIASANASSILSPANGTFYVGSAGTYTGYAGSAIEVALGQIIIVKRSSNAWSYELITIFQVDDAPTSGSAKLVKSGGTFNAIQNSPQLGYYRCNTAAATAAKTVVSDNYILPTVGGGCIKIKMTNANTAASGVTLQIGSAEAKPLYYAGQAVSASNTWQEGETVEVYYDGTNYQANNVVGGGSGDGVYDISAAHSGTAYANLAAALGTNGVNVHANVRQGGMSVKFVNISGEYEQWRYMGTSTANANFIVIDNWTCVDKLVDDLDLEINGTRNEESLDIASAAEYTIWCDVNMTWSNVGGYAGRKMKMLLIPSDTELIKITQPDIQAPDPSRSNKLVFLKSTTTPVNGAAIDACVGETAPRNIAVGLNTLDVPSDCVAIAIGTYTNKDITPTSIVAAQKVTGGLNYMVGILNEEVENNTYNINNLSDAVFGGEGHGTNIPLTGTTVNGWWVYNSAGSVLWDNQSPYNLRKMLVIPFTFNADKLIISQSENTNKLVFLKSYIQPTTTYQVADACEGTGVLNIAIGNNEYDIPSDCNYILVGIDVNGTDISPDSIVAVTYQHEGFAGSIDAINDILKSQYGFTTSKYETEKLAHISNIAFANGYFFIPYQADDTQPSESYAIYTNFIRLAVVSLCNLAQPKHFDVAKAGDTIGDISIGSTITSPHDPAIAIRNGYAYILFRASVGGKAVYLCRKFNISTMELESTCTKLTLDGEDFANAAVVNAYNTICGTSISSIEPQSMDFNSNVILASDGYYYGALGGLATNFYGLIFKSQDLINWTSVAANNINLGSMCGEVNIAEMSNGLFMVAYRDQTYNTILMTYNLSSGTWSNYKRITNSVRSRPCPFVYNGNCYVAMNVQGTDKTISGYGTAIRQNLAIYKVDASLNMELVTLLHRDCSIQYPALVVANENKLWMSFSTDTRHISAAQGRSNLELKELYL